MRLAMISLLTSTSSRHRPWQISIAVAIGVLAGLLPKSSLLCYGVLLLAYVLPVHLPLAVLTMLLLTALTPLVNHWLNELGTQSLTHPNWAAFWLRLDAYPLVPWLSFHNSLVHGAALVGGTLFLPIAIAVRGLVGALITSPALLQEKRDSVGVPTNLVPQESSLIAGEVDTIQATVQASDPDVHRNSPLPAPTELPQVALTISHLERMIASYDDLDDSATEVDSGKWQDGVHPPHSDRILRRAALLVSAVDDILTVIDSDEADAHEPDLQATPAADERSLKIVSDAIPTGACVDAPLDCVAAPSRDSDAPVWNPIHTKPVRNFDTSIEIVRATPGDSLDVQRDAAFAGPSHAHFSMEPRVGDPRNTSTRQFTSSTSSVAERMLNQHSAHAAAGITSRPASPSAQRSTARDAREGEVLRNLLNHLRELKEKV